VEFVSNDTNDYIEVDVTTPSFKKLPVLYHNEISKKIIRIITNEKGVHLINVKFQNCIINGEKNLTLDSLLLFITK
jgi:hypothetical protein